MTALPADLQWKLRTLGEGTHRVPQPDGSTWVVHVGMEAVEVACQTAWRKGQLLAIGRAIEFVPKPSATEPLWCRSGACWTLLLPTAPACPTCGVSVELEQIPVVVQVEADAVGGHAGGILTGSAP